MRDQVVGCWDSIADIDTDSCSVTTELLLTTALLSQRRTFVALTFAPVLKLIII